jgi:glycine cleavage system H lipoate-binding protein
MATNPKDNRRDQIGYGTTYRRGAGDEPAQGAIKTVLGGQAWLVKPDQKAKAARPCIWMQAGAVKFKNCTHFYDCATCSYDHAMGEKVQTGKQIGWQAALRLRPGMDRACRHSLTGRIAKRTCAYNYECAACDFDQFFEEVWSAKTPVASGEMTHVRGFDVPVDHYFHEGHTWARIESGGAVRVGMDDFVRKLLGTADGFDLPLMGKEFHPGKPSWGLKRKGKTADVLAPLGGVILAVNHRVREAPAAVGHEPYGEGWLFLVHTPNPKSSLKALMTDQQALGWMKAEVQQLEDMVEAVAGPLAADGGYFSEDIYGHLPGLGWERLTRTFLRT